MAPIEFYDPELEKSYSKIMADLEQLWTGSNQDKPKRGLPATKPQVSSSSSSPSVQLDQRS